MRLLCITAIITAVLLKGHAAEPASAEIPLEYREGLLWIKATAPQSSEPLNLLLDTGAGVTVLNTAAAERLGLTRGRHIAVQGVGTALKGYALKPLPLAANGTQLPPPALAVDLEKFSSSCAQRVDGLLGADFFRGRIIQIDFDAHKLRLLNETPFHPNLASVPLQLRPCGMRIPVTINGRESQWVRLDTGCASPLQWVTTKVRAEECMRKRAIGLTELSIAQTETTLQIGSETFEKVPTGIHDKPIFMGESGLIGNGLLSRFSSITIDARSGRLGLDGPAGVKH